MDSQEQIHGLAYPLNLNALPTLLSRPAPHTPIRQLNAEQLAALHLRAQLAHAPDGVLFPFLHGLEDTGCLRPRWGWRPRHAALYDGHTLIAAAPAYLKDNSHGEFVFDHAWAHAYARHGLDYYPKWLVAVPYSPVTGPRLLARDATARAALAHALREAAENLPSFCPA